MTKRAICLVLLVLSCAAVRAGAQCDPEWRPMGNGLDDNVLALTVYEEAVVASGVFTTPSRIARWDGSAWMPLGSGISGSSVGALTVYDGALIVGGSFTAAGGIPAQNIAAWDSSAWSALGGVNGNVAALIVHEGALIAGGSFGVAGGVSVSKVARWDGKAWGPMGAIPSAVFGASVRQFVVHNGELIAATGWHAAGVNGMEILRWQAPNWVLIGGLNVPVYISAGPFRLASYNGDLFASGFSTQVGPFAFDYHIRRWVGGTSWMNAGATMNGPVLVLAVHEGAMIAGGYFTSVNGNEANRVAHWNGATWSSLGAGVSGTVNAVLPHGGALVVAGNFLTAGGQAAPRVARWGCGCYVDCDASGSLTFADFGCFQTRFVNGDPYADCDGAGGLTIADFGCFQAKFASGCP